MEHPYLWAAMLVATLVAMFVAAIGAVVAFGVHSWLLRTTQMRLVSGVVAIVLISAAYVASIFALFIAADRQVNPPIVGFREFGIGYTFVHPGPLHKGAPVLAIVATWLSLARMSRRREGRKGAV